MIELVAGGVALFMRTQPTPQDKDAWVIHLRPARTIDLTEPLPGFHPPFGTLRQA
jgi:hypothetical protein